MAASLTPLEHPSEAEFAEAEGSASAQGSPSTRAAFGEYELLEEIGRGGMGIVYKARQRGLNRIVALKMVMPSRLTSAADLRRFQIEAEAAGRLDHPHILPIYEVGELSGQPYYTMKWVERGSLASTGPRAGCLTSTEASAKAAAGKFHSDVAALLIKIARAVAYAHERGVLHRDLKPGNILLDARGEPYVADFGLAKLMEQETGLSVSLPTLGTPGYAAPEQLQGGTRQVTIAADVYSLGAILYELLTGKPPFRGPTPVETIRQALENVVRPPHTLNPALDRDLETICLKCLNKEPKRRYASAGALADDLERWLASEPIQARPVGRLERGWLWCRRKPALAALAAGLVLTIVVASAFAGWRIRVARNLQRREAYYAAVGLADKFIQEGSTDRAMDLLLKCPDQLRHWEWGYLVAQCHQELLTIVAHTNQLPGHDRSRIRNLAFDASGERLVTCGSDGMLKVWDTRTGRALSGPGLARLIVASWAVHPSKPEIAAGLTNGTIRRYDIREGRALPALALPYTSASQASSAAAVQENVCSVAYASDGASLVAALASGAVSVWDLASGRLSWTNTVPVESPQAFFSTDREQVVVQGRLAAWWLSRDSGGIRNSRGLAATETWGLYACPDGRTQVTIGTAGELELLPPAGGPRRLSAIFTAESALDRQAIFSNDGQLFCTTGAGGTAGVFSASTGERLLSLPDAIFSGVFSPDSTRLVALPADRRAQVWDLGRRAQAMTLRGHAMIVECACFSADGRRIATGDRDGIVKIWSGSPGRSAFMVGGWPQTLRSSSDGRIITAAASYQYLKVWDGGSGRLLRSLRGRHDRPYGSDLSPDGRSLATASLDPVARLWDVTTGKLLGAFQGHTNALRAVRFSPDGRSLATADTAGKVVLWDMASHAQRHSLTGAGSYIYCIEFHPSADHAVITGPNDSPLVWNLKTGRRDRVLEETPGAWSARFSPSGAILAVAGLDGTLRLYDTSSWKTNGSFKSRGRGTGWMDFTTDGRRLAQAAADGGLFGTDAGWNQIWDAVHWRELMAVRGPSDSFLGTCFTKDPPRLVTANGDRMIYQLEAFPWRTADYANPPDGTLAQRIRSYAAAYWNQRLAEEQAATAQDEGTDTQRQPVDDLFLPPRSTQCEPRLIDLSPHYNTRLDGWLHPTSHDELADFTLAGLGAGRLTLLGVPFDARGVVVTRAFEPRGAVFQEIWELLPSRVEGIQVHQPVRRLHVLHATCPTNSVPDGTVVGSYIWHFSGGTTQEQPIIYGQDLRTWWWTPGQETSADLERGRVAWIGDTPRAAHSGARIRLYLTTYTNPRPELEVSHLDLISKTTQAAPFLVALTVEP